jgi:hypothetical protein
MEELNYWVNKCNTWIDFMIILKRNYIFRFEGIKTRFSSMRSAASGITAK